MPVNPADLPCGPWLSAGQAAGPKEDIIRRAGTDPGMTAGCTL
jgi:hypothetical protein